MNKQERTLPNFLPFVGKNYYDHKVLILGESHYGKPHENSNHHITIGVMEMVINRSGNWRYFANMTSVLDEHKDRSIWNNYGFYNYIQEIVGEGSRIRPSDEMWKNASKVFDTVVEDLKPKVIICGGEELYYHLIEGRHILSRHIIEEKPWCELAICDNYKIIAIPHASSFGFRTSFYREVIKRYM